MKFCVPPPPEEDLGVLCQKLVACVVTGPPGSRSPVLWYPKGRVCPHSFNFFTSKFFFHFLEQSSLFHWDFTWCLIDAPFIIGKTCQVPFVKKFTVWNEVHFVRSFGNRRSKMLDGKRCCCGELRQSIYQPRPNLPTFRILNPHLNLMIQSSVNRVRPVNLLSPASLQHTAFYYRSYPRKIKIKGE